MARKRPTIVDVARAAEVSLATASRALNGQDRVGPQTRARVQEVAHRLDYRPNVRAQRLRTGRSRSVALVTALPPSVVMEESRLGFMLNLAMPIAQECLNRDHSLVLAPPVSALAQLDALDVDGAIVLDAAEEDGISDRLRARGVTVVAFGRTNGVDGYLDRGDAGARVMFDHLAAAGATNVAVLLTTEPHSTTLSVLDYLASPHRSRPRHSILRAPATGGEEAGYHAALQALRDDPSIDAIYAPVDAFAVGAVRAAQMLGLTVPDRLMVATNYDGLRAASSTPPLTALDLSFTQIGPELVQLLFEATEGTGLRVRMAPAATLVPRASTQRR